MNEKGKIKVLLVCYDPTTIQPETRCLQLQAGLYIETASSNEEALVKLEKTKPDVIVCDFTGFRVSAQADGSKLVRTLRSKGDTTPFIVFSYEEDETELIAELRELGAVGFVEKSGDPSTVFSNLKSCIVHINAHP